MNLWSNAEQREQKRRMEEEEKKMRRLRAQEELRSDVSDSQLFDVMDETGENLLNITLDNRQTLINTENFWKGRVQYVDEQGRLRWKQIANPVISEEGMQTALSMMDTLMGKNSIMANRERTEMNRATIVVHAKICAIFAHRKLYGVDAVRRSAACWQATMAVRDTMSRSVGRQEGRDAYGRSKEIEHRQTIDEMNRRKTGLGVFS